MSVMFEITIDSWDERHRLTPDEVEHLTRFSVTPIATRKDDPSRLEYGVQPIIPSNALKALARVEPRVVRVIDNDGTRALAEYGQRNTTVVNERCRVAVAGLGLLTVDEVENCDDLCTDALQDKLNEGWRILAVCVQPDQRRPDYILGRTKAVA
jgi:hypothetical protein